MQPVYMYEPVNIKQVIKRKSNESQWKTFVISLLAFF